MKYLIIFGYYDEHYMLRESSITVSARNLQAARIEAKKKLEKIYGINPVTWGGGELV